MPRLADTLVEGTIARWLKKVAEPIAAGEPLASIETDKVTTELTSPSAGAVLELLAAEGDTVAVDTAIARIGTKASAAPPPPNPEPPPPPTERAPNAEPAPVVESAPVVQPARVVQSAPVL